MRYLFITPSFLPTMAGSEIELVKLISSIGKEKCDLLLPSYLKNSSHSAFNVFYFPGYFFRLNNYFPRFTQYLLNKLVGKEAFDPYKIVYLIFVYPTVPLFYKLLEPYASKVILVPQGGDLKHLMQSGLRPCIMHFWKTYYMSESMRKDLLFLYPYLSNLEYVPTGTDIDYLRKNMGHIRPQEINGKKLGKYIILTVARNVPKKNLQAIPKILNYLEGLDISWIIIGKGTNVSMLSTHDRIVVLDAIRITNLDEVPSIELVKYYSYADAYVVTSESEGLSLVTLDQLAINKPVFGFNVDGVREIFKEQTKLPEFNDYESISHLIRNYFERGESLELCDVNNFSWRNISKKYFQI